jgi:hypothetical protein
VDDINVSDGDALRQDKEDIPMGIDADAVAVVRGAGSIDDAA